MSYLGEKELLKYIVEEREPSFESFVNSHENDLIIWSSKKDGFTPSQLYSLWKMRFTLKLQKKGKLHLICESKTKYNKSTWENIQKMIQLVKKTKQSYQAEALNILTKSSTVASNMVQNSINLDITQHTGEDQEEDQEDQEQEQEQGEEQGDDTPETLFSEMNAEQRLHLIGYKKTGGEELNEAEKETLNLKSHSETASSQLLLNPAVSLLKKSSLNEFEQSAMELCLCKIYNQINPVIKSITEQNSDFDFDLQPPPLPLIGMNDASIGLFDQVLSLAPDMDEMMSFTQAQKSNLSKQKKRISEEYIMLNIVERVIENISLCDRKTKDSELTFYRRFAELLDCLFSGTAVKLADGETVCKSSKIAKEINKSLFHSHDTSTTYPRKIDLLMRLDDATVVELSSSEWKKSSVSESTVLKQQTKNLKVNVCILSLLYSVYGNKFDTVLAMDWIGNIGYLYRITKVDQVFIATQIDTLMIPENIETFGMLKDTLNNIFKLKYFMTSMSSLLQQELFKINSQTKLSNIAHNTDYVSQNIEFPYIFIPPTKKKKYQ